MLFKKEISKGGVGTCSRMFVGLCLGLVALEPTDLSDDVEKVWGGGQAATLGLDVGRQVVGQDFDHGLGGQLVHRVVLVVSPWQVGELLPRQLVDALDDLGQICLE